MHEHVAEHRKECAGDARHHYAAAMKITSDNQNNNHIEGSDRELEGRQRVDDKNAARERGRREKGTEPGKIAQHRIIAFRPDRYLPTSLQLFSLKLDVAALRLARRRRPSSSYRA